MSSREGSTQYTINDDPAPALPGKMRLGNDGISFYQVDEKGNKVFFAKQETRTETDKDATPLEADNRNVVEMDSISTQDFTIQLDSTLELSDKWETTIEQINTGQVTLKSVAGVTINGTDANSLPLIGGQGAAVVTVKRVGANTYRAFGAI